MSSRALAPAILVLVLVLAACSASPAATAPGAGSSSQPGGGGNPTAAATTAASAASAAPAASAAAIDLTGVDACALLDDAAVAALTGEAGPYTTSARDSGRTCFWGVTRPGVPQYVEISIFARPTGLAGYTFTPTGTCTEAAVAGVGAEARGGVCTGAQTKVYLLGWDRGVAVSVLVNEPKGGITPQGLAAAANLVLASLQ